MRIIARLIALAILCAVMAGCASRPLPAYPLLDAHHAISILADQQRRLSSAAGRGSVTLTRDSGQSVRLESAMAAQFPDHVRLRAWKMGHAVFDMTMTPDGVWMLVADNSRREQIMPAGASAAQFMRGWSMLNAGFYEDRALKVAGETEQLLVLERPTGQGQRVRATIDRTTLVVRRHEVLDEAGEGRFSLEYDKYRMVGEHPWPMRMRARGEAGEIEVEFDDVEINTPPAAGAFVPPRRAEKLQ